MTASAPLAATARMACSSAGSSHGVGQTRQLAAVDGGIQRHMNGHAPGMAEPDGFFQAVGIKIARTGAGVEAGKTQIYCIRAAEYCCAEHFFTAHRGKDLNF